MRTTDYYTDVDASYAKRDDVLTNVTAALSSM